VPRAKAVLAVASLLLLLAVGCGGGDDGDGRPRVVASFFPLAEVAHRVGGDGVAVTDLTPSGTEPHDLELTSDQVDELLDADLVVHLGGGFQPAVEDVVDQRDGATVDVLSALGVDEDADDVDPHVWLDPTQLGRIVDVVAGALADEVPDSEADVDAAARRYRDELVDLDADLASQLGDCRRELVVSAHDAFGRLARRYGLRTEALTGLSPEAEPDPGRLAELADLVEREGVTTVFTEALVAPDVAEVLAREAGVRTAVLDPIEGPSDGGYVGAMRRNGDALAEALGCS
jgi:zinc transport system substrate-binding protein